LARSETSIPNAVTTMSASDASLIDRCVGVSRKIASAIRTVNHSCDTGVAPFA
jgi:hypothetical protein